MLMTLFILKCHNLSTEGDARAVITHLPPTSEIGVGIPARCQMGKLVAAAVGQQFTVQNRDILYALVSSTLLATHHNITDTKILDTTYINTQVRLLGHYRMCNICLRK